MKPEVIFFDLDDTLMVEKASAERTFIEVSKYVENKYGINPDEFHSSIREIARDIWHKLPSYPYCKKIGISSWEGLWADFIGDHEMLKLLAEHKEYYQFTPWHITLQKFNIDNREFSTELAERFRKERKKRHVLFPETKNVLEKISADYKLGIITNGTPDLQLQKIKGGQISKYFNHIIISGEVNHGKPERQIFQIALDKFNTGKEKAIMVGDSIERDIGGAKAFGIKAVWLNRNNMDENNLPVKPDFIIRDLNDLLDLLNRIIKTSYPY
jgi:putative hydrolase of the HAD superfamily